jgi:hypothetical protein
MEPIYKYKAMDKICVLSITDEKGERAFKVHKAFFMVVDTRNRLAGRKVLVTIPWKEPNCLNLIFGLRRSGQKRALAE